MLRGIRRGRTRRAIVAGAGALALAITIGGCGSSYTGPSQSHLQSKIQNWLEQNLGSYMALTNVTCVPPSSWTPGKTFTCFVTLNNKGFGVVKDTILPTKAGYSANWYESWSLDK